ncbi:MetS family NSS transporter small subunit [Peptoclostridium acidaminophilum]|nr:MetS family NSS transporter small subunit [Peptoclostridium acidaminophilum]
MAGSAVLMMVIGCGAVWGGAVIAIIIALRADKKAYK